MNARTALLKTIAGAALATASVGAVGTIESVGAATSASTYTKSASVPARHCTVTSRLIGRFPGRVSTVLVVRCT